MNLSKRIIEYFRPGEARTLLSAREANKLCWIANALVGAEIKRGDSDAIFFSDGNLVIQVKRAGETGPPGPAGSGNMTYRGEYNNATVYDEFDVVRVSPGNAAVTGGYSLAGIFICVADAPGSTNRPKHPLQTGGENAYWDWLSTWPYETKVCDEEGTEIPFAVDGQELPEVVP